MEEEKKRDVWRLKVELDIRKRDYEHVMGRLQEFSGHREDASEGERAGYFIQVMAVVALLGAASERLLNAYDRYVAALEVLVPGVEWEEQ